MCAWVLRRLLSSRAVPPRRRLPSSAAAGDLAAAGPRHGRAGRGVRRHRMPIPAQGTIKPHHIRLLLLLGVLMVLRDVMRLLLMVLLDKMMLLLMGLLVKMMLLLMGLLDEMRLLCIWLLICLRICLLIWLRVCLLIWLWIWFLILLEARARGQQSRRVHRGFELRRLRARGVAPARCRTEAEGRRGGGGTEVAATSALPVQLEEGSVQDGQLWGGIVAADIVSDVVVRCDDVVEVAAVAGSAEEPTDARVLHKGPFVCVGA